MKFEIVVFEKRCDNARKRKVCFAKLKILSTVFKWKFDPCLSFSRKNESNLICQTRFSFNKWIPGFIQNANFRNVSSFCNFFSREQKNPVSISFLYRKKTRNQMKIGTFFAESNFMLICFFFIIYCLKYFLVLTL
jgi:hypothetical protein